MSELGIFLNNSSGIKEELQEFFAKLSSGLQVDPNYFLEIIKDQDLSSDCFEILKKLAFYFEEKKMPEFSYVIYKKLSLFSDKYLGKVVEGAFSNGDLFLAELAVKKYLNYLVRKKNFSIGMTLIEELIKRGIGKDYIKYYGVIFSVFKGDVKNFENLFNQLKYDFFSYETYRMALSALSFVQGKEKKWAHLKGFKKLKLLKLFFMIKDLEEENILLRKEFFNLLFEFKCLYPNDNFGLILISQYSKFFNSASLILAVNDYLQNNKKKITKEEYYKAIKNDKNFVKKTSKVAEQVKPEEEKGMLSFLGKKILEKKELIDKEFFINQRCMMKVCELLDDQLIFKSYNDLVVCFLTMEFYEVANSILDRIEKNINAFTIEEKINHEYLRINLLLLEKKYWEALARGENLLITYPLMPEEEKCFLYLNAEAKFFMGRKQEAKEIYLRVKKTSPNYRLVENRLLEIEINK